VSASSRPAAAIAERTEQRSLKLFASVFAKKCRMLSSGRDSIVRSGRGPFDFKCASFRFTPA
jgi:hypothetical protein